MKHKIALVKHPHLAGLIPSLDELADAIAQQVEHDFAPHWKIDAVVSAFNNLNEIPNDYWTITISPPNTASGHNVHGLKQPFATVGFNANWTIEVSHECLEMLCNATRNRVINGPSPVATQGMVPFEVEICDPVDKQSYLKNGIPVSNFCLPSYYNSMIVERHYDFAGTLRKPLDVIIGGQLRWVYTPPTGSPQNWILLRHSNKGRAVPQQVFGGGRDVSEG